ncbi:hypothetical protein LOTGIDRAFT_231833 [Lottia gigantea]|uniref:UspA domain-containing protein n=1 Tax=Lottia gigantea TaxID=225164 RepID=V4C3I4_LOTGI|nr:hypothetical protein LOTGIDRAFT_231833 [Lottia gigantea]ESO96099.1 hypothetical protein LOTGIDRAFT_231833 [Lottia gigantea]
MEGKTSTVLLAVDNSSNAEYCMNFYLQRLHKQGNKLVILHVPEYWGDMARMMSPARLTEVYNESQKRAKVIGEKFHTIAAKNSVSDIEFVTKDGNDPWHVIVDVAKDKKVDFIVMGSRGMDFLTRASIGSVQANQIAPFEVGCLFQLRYKTKLLPSPISD